uniref:Uncharacterized protein n=1 Tax=Candidatus Kentrum sp. TC TaxID=2126339 RepID=A0A450YSM3_9GAMM|nr:MAG: hypothetical protein BECKTC1821E_GA0114239_103614 [Candidatus Kentron sp. TC]
MKQNGCCMISKRNYHGVRLMNSRIPCKYVFHIMLGLRGGKKRGQENKLGFFFSPAGAGSSVGRCRAGAPLSGSILVRGGQPGKANSRQRRSPYGLSTKRRPSSTWRMVHTSRAPTRSFGKARSMAPTWDTFTTEGLERPDERAVRWNQSSAFNASDFHAFCCVAGLVL